MTDLDPIVLLEDEEFQKLFEEFPVDSRWRSFYARLACFILAKARVMGLPDAKSARALPVAVEAQADEIRMLKAENAQLRESNKIMQRKVDMLTEVINGLGKHLTAIVNRQSYGFTGQQDVDQWLHNLEFEWRRMHDKYASLLQACHSHKLEMCEKDALLERWCTNFPTHGLATETKRLLS